MRTEIPVTIRKINKRLNKRDARLVNLRLFSFFGALATAVICYFLGWPILAWAGIALGLFGLGLGIAVHHRLDKTRKKWSLWQSLFEESLAKRTLNWDQIRVQTPRMEFPGDLQNATDLNLFGNQSLMRLMNTTVTEEGYQSLTHDLAREDWSVEEILHRQTQVKELCRLPLFRRKIHLVSLTLDSDLIETRTIVQFFEHPVHTVGLTSKTWFLAGLQAVGWALVIWAIINGGLAWYFFPFALYYWYQQKFEKYLNHPFDRGVTLQIALERLSPLFQIFENRQFPSNSSLVSLLEPFQTERPSETLEKISFVTSCLSARANPLVHLFLNTLVPWDYIMAIWMEKIRQRYESQVPKWIKQLGKIESLLAIADFSASLPNGCFPTISEEGHSFLKARQLAHPLIPLDKCVPNDFTISSESPCIVITGSNMSGKSTFLRTIGINAWLARLGAKVRAQSFEIQNCQVRTLIRAEDNLEREMSLFHFEVRRLKEILEDAKASSITILYLIDEIFRGTNNQERYTGALSYLKNISQYRSAGLVSTHDLRIADLANIDPKIQNYHFREEMKQGSLSYDYLIRAGICQSTNALKIMVQEGLPVESHPS